MKELSKRFIERQDWFCYYGINIIDSSIGILENCNGNKELRYREILELMSKENVENLRQYSIKNLMHIIGNTKVTEEDRNKIIQLISDKMDNGEIFYTEENTTEVFMKPVSQSNFEFSKMGKTLQEKVKEDILKRRDKVEGENYQEILNYFTKYTDMSNFLYCYEQGIFTDEKIEKLEKALKENSKALDNTNFAIFKDEIYKNFEEEFVLYALKFPNLSIQLDILSKENPELLQIVANKVSQKQELSESVNLAGSLIKYFTNNCYEITVDRLTEKVSSNLIDSALRNNKSKRDEKIIAVPYSENYENDLEEKFNDEYQKIINYDESKEYFSNRETKSDKLKNLYLNKYFSISIKEANSILEMYAVDIEKLNSEKGKKFIQSITKVLEIQNVEALDFSKFHNQNIEEIEEIKSEIEREYALSYTEELAKTKKELDSTLKRTIIEHNGKSILQIEPGEDFNLLLHSTDAGFISEGKLAEHENLKEKWKTSDNTFNHIISMTYVNQDFMGMAPVGENGVMYGFTSVNSKNVKMMGNTDINTFSNEFGYSAVQKKYLTAKSMPYNSRRVYSEVAVERKETKPDYVIIFEDYTEKNIENAYKAATDWNIPVVLLNKEKIKDNQIQRLEKIRKDFEETKNPEKLHELLNTYETNMAGWLLNRKPDEKDESFTQMISNERFREDFENEYNNITKTIDEYLEGFDINDDRTEDLVRTMQIILEEQDLYEKCDKKKPISKTQNTIKTVELIEKINTTMERVGAEEYIIDKQNIPTKKQYDNLIKLALGKEKIGIEDVMEAEAQLAKDKNREANRNDPNR